MKTFRSSNKLMTPSIVVQQKEGTSICGIDQLLDYVKSQFGADTTKILPDYRFLDMDECQVVEPHSLR